MKNRLVGEARIVVQNTVDRALRHLPKKLIIRY